MNDDERVQMEWRAAVRGLAESAGECRPEEQWIDFYRGRCTPSEADALREHLVSCPRCRELAADARAFVAAMGELAEPGVTPAPRRSLARSLAWAAALALLLGGSLWLGMRGLIGPGGRTASPELTGRVAESPRPSRSHPTAQSPGATGEADLVFRGEVPSAAPPEPEELPAVAAVQPPVEAEELLSWGERQLAGFNLARAVGAARRVVARAATSGDRVLEARARLLLGAARGGQGRTAEARRELAAARDIARAAGDPALAARALAARAFDDWKHADYASALAVGDEAEAEQLALGDLDGQARTLRYLGRVRFKRGEYEAARQAFRRSLAIAEGEHDASAIAESTFDLAAVDRDQWRMGAAKAGFERVAEIARAAGDRAGELRARYEVGVLELFVPEPDHTLAIAEELLPHAAAAGDLRLLADLVRLRGRARQELGRKAAAVPDFVRAAELYAAAGDPPSRAWVLADAAQLQVELGEPSAALATYRQALAVWTEIDDRRALAWHWIEVGQVQELLGELGEARASYRLAAELATAIRLPYTSQAFGELAQVELRLGEPAAALASAERAVAASRLTENADMRWEALQVLAEVHAAAGRKAQALVALRECVETIEQLRTATVATDRARAASLEDKQKVYAEAIGLLFDAGSFAEALEMSERDRARAFLDLLAGRGDGESGATATTETSGAAAAGSPDPGAPAELPARAIEPAPRWAELRAIAGRLDATVVEYFAAPQRLFVWVVGPRGEVRATSTPIAYTALATLVATAGSEDAVRGRAPGGSAPAEPRAALRRLREVLIDPIEAWLPADPDALVTLIPHGALHRLSFAALVDREGRYLIERHTLSYGPSLLALGRIAPSAAGGRIAGTATALVVGDPEPPPLAGGAPLAPLPAAAEEARAIAAQFGPERSVTLLGRDASEPRVRALAPGRTVLHFATHGRFRDDDPLGSLLVLAPDATVGTPPAADRDGLWTAREIFSTPLVGTELVTLSACRSGVGRLSGDGVLGLSRAFLVAGARSVVVSLWPVADPVASFEMAELYRDLLAGPFDRARALRRAQLATLAALREGRITTAGGRPLAEQPRYWAPFLLIGASR